MTLDFSLDDDSEEVDVVLDNQIVLRASRDLNGRVVFGKNFSKIDDDELAQLVRFTCEKLLALHAV